MTQRKERDERDRGPSVPAEELGPAITGSLMEIRSKAATIGAVKSMPERWHRGR